VKLNVFASRHSAFYSPLIASITAGFLAEEGIDAAYRVLAPGERSQDLIREGKADIIQSAVSSNWKPMEAGNSPLPMHFAQINRRDGFFLAGRTEDPAFNWKKLEGRTLLADHGGQPLSMLKYAVHHNGADWSRIKVTDRGAPEKMMEAFRAGEGDYVHLQGPGPEILADEGYSKSAVPVGAAMPAVAFSSLCCSRAFAGSSGYEAFLRGYAKAREWVRSAEPAEVAAKEIVQFPNLKVEVLEASVARYQALGNWEGPVAIDRDLYEQALNVFEFSRQIKARHSYDAVCV
jgi:NitT/TauT family transport system substrate-binding protein